jgi:hypothetical protein
MWHIADFVLLDDKIIIEVDGKSHLTPKQRAKDVYHTMKLMAMGWRVVRCTNEEAINHPHVTVAELLGNRLTHHPTLAELEEALRGLDPTGALSQPKRRGRRPKRPPPNAAPGARKRGAKPPKAKSTLPVP